MIIVEHYARMIIVNTLYKASDSNKNKGIKAVARILSVLLVISLFAQVLVGCSRQEEPIKDDELYYSFTDALGNTVKLKEKPQRVVSLVGSYAQTWVLAGGDLVGVTNDVVNEGRMDLSSQTKLVGTVKEPNAEEIIALSPDFVLLSPDIENQVKLSEILDLSGICYAYFKVEHFEDYLDMLKVCTDITGEKDLYEKNGLQVKKQIETIMSKVDEGYKPQILFIRAFSSGAKAKDDDNMACKILNDFGTVNIASKHKSLLEDLSMEQIIEEDPEYIFVVTMGDSEKALKTLRDGIEKNPAWSELKAIKNDRYIVLPKDLFHYKPNARWGESYEFIAKILYLDKFN